MNIGDIDISLELYHSYQEIKDTLDDNVLIYACVHNSISYGHHISAYSDIIKVPSRWIELNNVDTDPIISVKKEYQEEYRKLLVDEVEWISNDLLSNDLLSGNRDINEIVKLDVLTTSDLYHILYKKEEKKKCAERELSSFKEFAYFS